MNLSTQTPNTINGVEAAHQLELSFSAFRDLVKRGTLVPRNRAAKDLDTMEFRLTDVMLLRSKMGLTASNPVTAEPEAVYTLTQTNTNQTQVKAEAEAPKLVKPKKKEHILENPPEVGYSSTKEAIKAVGIPPASFYDLVNAGVIGFIVLDGKRVYKTSDLKTARDTWEMKTGKTPYKEITLKFSVSQKDQALLFKVLGGKSPTAADLPKIEALAAIAESSFFPALVQALKAGFTTG